MKKFISKIFTALLSILIACAAHFYVAQAKGYTNSGRSSLAKLTFPQLKALYDDASTDGISLYKTEPKIKGGYKASTLTSSACRQTKNLINYYRRAAGLSRISFSSTLNESASYGALVMAGLDDLSHCPSKPAGMSNSMYNKGKTACSSSNLSYAYGIAENELLAKAIQGQMADSSSFNIDCVGHRRWILDPRTKTMGIGTANNSKNYYTALRVFGSNVSTKNVSDYKFIAWPASGNNLSDTFPVSTPWSITLNPSKFKAPSLSKVKVTLKEVSTGKSWTFNSKTNHSSCSDTKDYFNINNDGYGISNCIIFRPAYSKLSTFQGDYIVKVSGLSGDVSSFSYKVTFASYDSIQTSDSSILNEKESSAKVTAPPKTSFQKLTSSGKKSLNAIWKKNKAANGYQVQSSTAKKFNKQKKTLKVSSSKTSCKISKLTSKKKYYVRIRAYKKVNGTTIYGPWSNVKSSKVK